MRNISDKFVEKVETHVLCSITFLKNRFVYVMMWKNIVELGRPQMTVGRMRISRWVPKAKNKHSKYVILIAFLLQQ
jgi:hypothetical protein